MGYTQQKSKKKKKKKIPNRREKKAESLRSSWVDNISFHPFSPELEKRAGASLSLISWNVLAEAYCSRKSHPGLPHFYAKEVFHKVKRRNRILQILKHFAEIHHVDVICLQEVDQNDISKLFLEDLGYYSCIESPRIKGGGSGGKADGCGIYVRKGNSDGGKGSSAAHWSIEEHDLVRLDDLATLSTLSPVDCLPEVKYKANNLQGLQQSLLRRNVGLLVRLKHLPTGRTVVVANAHLYWNPEYEYVKLCQAHYILLRAKHFCRENESFILAGDLNSRPCGLVHSYLTKGHVNARKASPWHRFPQEDKLNEGKISLGKRDDEEQAETDLLAKISGLHIDGPNEDGRNSSSSADAALSATKDPSVRYLLDFTLNKFCRWLRILGVDASLETEEEERLRTKEGRIVIFQRCRTEGRTLVTTSTKLMLRHDCPAGAYCISPAFLSNLEVPMVHMFLTHGVVLEPSTFLCRCVVCNGKIVTVAEPDEKRRILESYQCSGSLSDTMDVYECNTCGQGYWWCDRPTSSASRVKNQATHLFELCLRAGVPIRGDLEMFDFVDVEEQRLKGWDESMKGSELLHHKLDVVEWLKNERLACPFELQSSYGKRNKSEDGERLPFTNVTRGFVGTLDYIFFDPSRMVQTEELYVPASYSEMNEDSIENGHLLPSDVWPSDHLAIGTRVVLF